MKVAIVRQRYNPFGGAERFVERAMAALGGKVELSIITRKWPGGGHTAIECNPFYLGSLWRDWGFARCVCNTLGQQHFDLVQSHERLSCCDIYRAGDGVHAEWLVQRRHVQNRLQRWLTRLSPYHRYMMVAERRMFESPELKAVVCISELVKHNILQHFNIAASKLHVIYNGVDLQHFHPDLVVRHRARLRAELGIAESAPVLLFVGSGFERKGLATALQVVARLSPETHLVVVGKDKRQRRYQNMAKSLQISHRVHFMGGKKEIAAWYGMADVLVFPTLYEPFGNVVLEAMASGLPVATTPTAGGAELIQHGVNGLVCDALDANGFAVGLRQLLLPTKLREAAQAARVTAETYTWDRMAEKMVALYQSLRPGVDV